MIDFGIDFGTTNTAVVECIRTSHDVSTTPCGEGNLPFPSLVALHATEPFVFGMEVKKRRHQLRARGYTVISSFKSILGSPWQTTVGKRTWSAVEVTALFLQYVRQSVEKQCGTSMREAVISIPVDFSREQRKALREAASVS